MTTALEPGDLAARPAEGVMSPRYRGATLGIVMLVTLLAFESMAVGTVMPAVADDLNGLSLFAWGFSATLIASLLSTVLAGGWVDRAGPSRPLMIGLATFVAGLATAGSAPSMWLFVVGRTLQGLGTGLAVAGVLFAAIAVIGIVAALRLEVRK